MRVKRIETGCYGIVVELTVAGSASVTSDMKEVCPHCHHPLCDFDCPLANKWATIKDAMSYKEKKEELESNRLYNYAMDALESMILGHACAGIDITTPAYIEGIESAVQGCANSI